MAVAEDVCYYHPRTRSGSVHQHFQYLGGGGPEASNSCIVAHLSPGFTAPGSLAGVGWHGLRACNRRRSVQRPGWELPVSTRLLRSCRGAGCCPAWLGDSAYYAVSLPSITFPTVWFLAGTLYC